MRRSWQAGLNERHITKLFMALDLEDSGAMRASARAAATVRRWPTAVCARAGTLELDELSAHRRTVAACDGLDDNSPLTLLLEGHEAFQDLRQALEASAMVRSPTYPTHPILIPPTLPTPMGCAHAAVVRAPAAPHGRTDVTARTLDMRRRPSRSSNVGTLTATARSTATTSVSS